MTFLQLPSQIMMRVILSVKLHVRFFMLVFDNNYMLFFLFEMLQSVLGILERNKKCILTIGRAFFMYTKSKNKSHL